MTQLWRSFGYAIPLFLIATIIVCAIAIVLVKKKGNETVVYKNTIIMNIIFPLSIIAILLITVTPRHIGMEQIRVVNLIPFIGMYKLMTNYVDIMVPIKNILFNIILFMPFGFTLLWKNHTKLSIYQVTMIGFIFSLLIEFIQYVFPSGRSSDIDDVILNTVGTLLGCLFWNLIYTLFPKFLKTSNKNTNIQNNFR
ncbi:MULTISPECIES: VanZ family protein [Bacillus cereus group]|uniref:VanZ family protein n=1 Tax=Bacillus cereus group TaxID=86661 RepID=UPI0020CA2A86|nr:MULTISPECIES: VanZ family protein [Bacillus cereus group]WOA60299.1 VanZ family protein [Bacillus mycoides]